MIERFVYRVADHLIVVTEGARQNIIAKGVPGAKVSVLPHWIDEKPFLSSDPAAQYGGDPTMKLFYARHWAQTTALALTIQGANGVLWGESALDDGLWQQTFCGQYAVRLGGGTDEIQGNVIGERALGLPREPATDRDLPWRETRGSGR